MLTALGILAFLNLTAGSQAFAASESILWNFGNGTDGVNPYGGLVADKDGNLYGTTYQGGTFAAPPFYNIAGTLFELKPPTTPGAQWTESILWSFGHGDDGSEIVSGPIMDASGNLYGTTSEGGAYGWGTVYELKPPTTAGGDWTESILWSFGHGSDGSYPFGDRLIMDAGGNIYGTTRLGGTYNGGTVFELRPLSTTAGVWTESVLWNFGDGTDGANPSAGLVEDRSGNLYGTTLTGGSYSSPSDYSGAGTVYELKPPPSSGGDWTESILWNFGNGTDGQGVLGGLIMDSSGNLYGITLVGGIYYSATACSSEVSCAGGTVFELTPPSGIGGDWTESILWNFGNSTDGANPIGDLVEDESGNLYGTNANGGANGLGTVFQLKPPSANSGQWGESILWSFGNGTDGTGPLAGLIVDAEGNLYGTTGSGGAYPVQGLDFAAGGGTVFKINPSGSASPTPTPMPSELIASPSRVNFGNVSAGGTSAAKKVTLTNKGKVAAAIATVSTTGPFIIAGGPNSCTGATIAPGNSCSFDVEFVPTTVANESGGIEVTYNGASPDVAFTGVGIAVTLKAPKSASLPPASAGSQGTAKSIVLANLSSVQVVLGTAALGGTDPGSFKITGDTCSGQPLPVKTTCAIAVAFAPPIHVRGTQSATLSVGFMYRLNAGNVSVNVSGTVK